jgi:hypothetical protein
MQTFPRIVVGRLIFTRPAVSCLVLAGLCVQSLAQTAMQDIGAPQASARPAVRLADRPASVRQVKVLDSRDAVEIEVEASDRIIPQTQVLTGPDRLVVDFPNATPGSQLRSQSVNRGEVKDVRFGLFQATPPVTRLVLDLRTAQSYQVFPYGRTVIIKVTGSAPDAGTSPAANNFPSAPVTRPGLVNANYTAGSARVAISRPAVISPPVSVRPSIQPVAQPALEVSFREGLLAIKTDKATLSEVLYAVQQRTGADIAIPAGAEQEKVAVDLGPAPAQEVLANLLNGSRFNFLILSAANDPRQLDRVILTPRTEGAMPTPPAQTNIQNSAQNNDASDDDAQPELPADTQPTPVPPTPVENVPKPRPEIPPAASQDPQ